MTKKIACNDLFPGCSFTAEAETEQELLAKVAPHAAHAHGITEITPDVVEQVRAVIHDEP
jgi:predicted small metal-binding protein